MLFNSIAFAIFLPVVFILYWILPVKNRWMLLLAASYYFYMGWNAKYVVLIFTATFISYFCAILMEKASSIRVKRICMLSSAIVILGILFLFKYYNFFLDNLSILARKFSITMNPYTLKLILPVGISFYTFQTLSYVIDVYKGKIRAEKHLGYYAAFVSFFPQLVAGPIERASNLLPQIKEERKFEYEKASYGVKLMAVGYFKKIVLADTLAKYVDIVFADVYSYHGFTLFLASLFFTFQIYCDFSGYSDIAVGTAKMFGINLMNNFNSPYFSVSIHDFWKRWHISLSTFFKDYVYIPLGGNRMGKIKNMANLMVTFLLSGLWHGASWNYIVWGGVHGILQIFENITNLRKNDSKKIWVWWKRVIITFLIINITWIFFRTNIKEAFYIIKNMFQGILKPELYFTAGIAELGIDWYSFITIMVFVLFLLVYDYISLKKDIILVVSGCSIIGRWLIYIIFILLICIFSQKGVAAEFVYFQF
jgi:D-alanyl-lipoteichoic acid acyltransferase DltB (MBOAT superfamily)